MANAIVQGETVTIRDVKNMLALLNQEERVA